MTCTAYLSFNAEVLADFHVVQFANFVQLSPKEVGLSARGVMSHCSWGRVPGSGNVPVWEGPSARDCDNSQLQLLDLAQIWDGSPSTVFSKDLVLTGPDCVLSRVLGAITADSFKQLDQMCVASCARGDRQRFGSPQSCSVRGLATP